jgi:hypothetical protein
VQGEPVDQRAEDAALGGGIEIRSEATVALAVGQQSLDAVADGAVTGTEGLGERGFGLGAGEQTGR